MIVVDASAVLEILLQTSRADRCMDRIFKPGEIPFAPYLIDIEVVQVLRRYVSFSEITPGRGREAIEDLRTLPLERYPHEPFLERMWELRHNLTAYDAVYVAMSEIMKAPLITCDRRISNAAGHDAFIELID